MFVLIHACCDGAGVAGRFDTLEQAKAEADRLQRQSDESGNPFGYHYTVYLNGREMYRTQSHPRSW